MDQAALPTADSGKIFIGGLPKDSTTESLASYFKQFGEIADCVVMRDRVTQAPRGFGFVTYADPSISQHVVTIKHVVDGKEVEAKIAVPRADEAKPLPPPVASVEYSSRKVFVGGLSHETSEGEFREYFEQWGNVVDCVIMIDPNTRKPRGFGFVTYEHALSAEELCSAPFAHELRGKRIEIKRAIPQERMGGPPTAKPAGQVPPSLMQARLPSDSQLRPYQALAPRGASPVANAPVLSTGGVGARGGLPQAASCLQAIADAACELRAYQQAQAAAALRSPAIDAVLAAHMSGLYVGGPHLPAPLAPPARYVPDLQPPAGIAGSSYQPAGCAEQQQQQFDSLAAHANAAAAVAAASYNAPAEPTAWLLDSLRRQGAGGSGMAQPHFVAPPPAPPQAPPQRSALALHMPGAAGPQGVADLTALLQLRAAAGGGGFAHGRPGVGVDGVLGQVPPAAQSEVLGQAQLLLDMYLQTQSLQVGVQSLHAQSEYSQHAPLLSVPAQSQPRLSEMFSQAQSVARARDLIQTQTQPSPHLLPHPLPHPHQQQHQYHPSHLAHAAAVVAAAAAAAAAQAGAPLPLGVSGASASVPSPWPPPCVSSADGSTLGCLPQPQVSCTQCATTPESLVYGGSYGAAPLPSASFDYNHYAQHLRRGGSGEQQFHVVGSTASAGACALLELEMGSHDGRGLRPDMRPSGGQQRPAVRAPSHFPRPPLSPHWYVEEDARRQRLPAHQAGGGHECRDAEDTRTAAAAQQQQRQQQQLFAFGDGAFDQPLEADAFEDKLDEQQREFERSGY